MNTGSLTRRDKPSRRRVWMLLLAALVAVAGIAAVLSFRTPGAAPDESDRTPRSATATTHSPIAASGLEPTVAPSAPPEPQALPTDEPFTLDFRQLATVAARSIYSWDTRTATYSQTYEQIRAWWHLLPDGSNPLTVFADQFEATGINAAAYASLTGDSGYRTANAVSTSCDAQLAQFVQYPAPWNGLHVCTVTLAVTEHASSGTNSYTAPISVVVNCPPAATAPADRCAMVAFYASPDRIVY